MKTHLILTSLFVIASSATAQLTDHSTFGEVLDRHLRNDLFDYGALKDDRTTFDTYLSELARTDLAILEAASQNEQLAFWINAYNACALQIVVDNYPIARRGVLVRIVNSVKGYPANSIQQIPSRWDGKYCTVANEERSLDDIEHGIIRPMGDPRIHFAVNCASRSCPSIASEPYVGERVDQQLDRAVRYFIGDPRHFALHRGDARLVVNKVLDWYKDDFGGIDGLKTFFAAYLAEPDATLLREDESVDVSFFDYDWTLNDTAVFDQSSRN